jgi:hypothetical protein
MRYSPIYLLRHPQTLSLHLISRTIVNYARKKFYTFVAAVEDVVRALLMQSALAADGVSSKNILAAVADIVSQTRPFFTFRNSR